jgi:O-antigen ligase
MTTRSIRITPASAVATARGVVLFAPLAPLADFGRIGVAVAIVASGVVRWEPAPVDLVLVVLIGLLPLAGIAVVTRQLALGGTLWLACGAGAVVASGLSLRPGWALLHACVSLYLYGACVVLAGFVAAAPQRHARIVLSAWVWAALAAAIAGLVGYFDVLPGASEHLTKFGRAAGTFKDPNVLGAFLVPPLLWLFHRVLECTPRRAMLPLAGAAILALAILLSFSRGAWINLAVATLVYGYLVWVTAPDDATLNRITLLGALVIAALAAVLVVASRSEAVAGLLAERASLSQGYDVGPESRFGGQQKAMAVILASPLGIGAGEFHNSWHHEDVHNVYLSMFLNAGWLGGTIYLFLVGATVVVGLAHLLRDSATRPIFIVAYASFVAVVVEGFVIDTDHWRHFYFLIALVWGLVAAEDRVRSAWTRKGQA